MPHPATAGSSAVPAVPTGPLPVAQRILAPDLARGVMLLVIALAHAYFFSATIGGNDVVHSAADRVVTAGTTMLVEFRGYPMFAALFGYGMAQIYRRRIAEGRAWRWVRSLLRRRALWLIVFGLAHVTLLFFGDILAVYGLVALMFVGVLRLRDRTLMLLIAAWLPLSTALHALAAAGEAISGTTGPPLALPDGFIAEISYRFAMFSLNGPVMVVSTVVPFLLGILAARHRILEEPHSHLRLLRLTAFTGIPVGALGGLPLALVQAGTWDHSLLTALVAGGLHQLTGYACGLGYAALIALVAARFTGREGPVTAAVAALGQRSMTFYLAQSLAWVALFASYTLHLQVTPVVAVLISGGVWLTTLVLADQMGRRGIRGPAEVALRRLTYPTSAEPVMPQRAPASRPHAERAEPRARSFRGRV